MRWRCATGARSPDGHLCTKSSAMLRALEAAA
jgi:hypothetical protein